MWLMVGPALLCKNCQGVSRGSVVRTILWLSALQPASCSALISSFPQIRVRGAGLPVVIIFYWVYLVYNRITD